MRDNLIIFPATTSYLAEARVLLKSLVKHMPDVPVHIMSKNGEADSLKEFPNVELIIDAPPCDTEFRQVRTYRFFHAAEMGNRYKVVCLLDADMLCVYNFEHIFRMADTGTILACSNNTLFRYLSKDFKNMFVEAPDDINCVHTSFSTVPMFINSEIHKDYLMKIWNNKTGNDLETNNLYAAAMGLMKQLYLLNSQNWTGIHHTFLKPNLFVRKVDDGYVSDLGERIFCFHGHWLDDDSTKENNYVKQLLEPMVKNFGYHPPYIECAKNCIKVIAAEYAKYR